MSRKVAVYCCNHLYGEGIALMLGGIPNLAVTNCVRPEDVRRMEPNLLVADFTSILQVRFDELANHGTLLMLLEIADDQKNEDHFIASFIGKGLVGILTPDADAFILRKAVQGICSGELWIGRKKLKTIIAEGASRPKEFSGLTDREVEIVRMVCKGYRNKEIMQMLDVSEQSVKSHLYRVFRKVGVADRLQLALYFMKRSEELGN